MEKWSLQVAVKKTIFSLHYIMANLFEIYSLYNANSAFFLNLRSV